MDSMDFTYYASNDPQSYQYLGYTGDPGLLGNGLTMEGVGIHQSLESPLDPNFAFGGSFDYNSLPLGSMAGSSASPPAQHVSLLPNMSVDSGIADMDHELVPRRDSSEDKDNLTPAQSRRKAQNRAAQRAFRHRKETHVKNLEAKLNLLSSTTSSLRSEVDRLKIKLQRAQTENGVLRATASSSPGADRPPSFVDDPSLLPGPRIESSIDVSPHGLITSASTPSTRTATDGSESRMLSAPATWDLLQSHPLYLSGAVDLGEVCERFRRMAKCDGLGPMFDEEEVKRVIEDVGRSGGDELI